MLCEQKKGYSNRGSAEKAITMIWKQHIFNNKRKKPCASYKCNICGKWHLTSQAQKKRSK